MNVRLEVLGQIGLLRVERPQALNALNRTTLEELHTHLQKVATSPLRVLILTGAGEKSFMAGADIVEMKGYSSEEGERFARLGQQVTEQIEALPQPVIAAVNGYALGGGCELAMACDLILASENALFGQPEALLGMTPFFGGCCRLQRWVGMARAKELIFTGRKISAREAKEIGLALEVLPPSELLLRAKAMAHEMEKMSPLAIAQAKRTIHDVSSLPLSEGLKLEAKRAAALFGTPDQREGMLAFVEKRPPHFGSLYTQRD